MEKLTLLGATRQIAQQFVRISQTSRTPAEYTFGHVQILGQRFNIVSVATQFR